MKCINIVYNKRRIQQEDSDTQFFPVKKTVDEYYTRLIEKQKQRIQFASQSRSTRLDIRTSKSFRTRSQYVNQMTQSLNIAKIKAESIPVSSIKFTDEQTKNKKNNNFSIKKKQNGVYSLKGLKDRNIFQSIPKHIRMTISQKQKNHSKIKALQKTKLLKQSTILISIDFILNQQNFWYEQDIDEQAAKNWKYLQDYSNIIWLVKRQNSNKKLQKFSIDFGLRLDGVYQIIPHQKQKCLTLSLQPLQKQIKVHLKSNKKYIESTNNIIVINSLRVQNIKHAQYQQFLNVLPITKSISCIVHFIQVDMQDKQRFNSPLKILSKQHLPLPTKLDKIIQRYQNQQLNEKKQKLGKKQRKYNSSATNIIDKIQSLKQNYLDYFCQRLKLNPNQKINLQGSQISLQYLIGDMLKRNYNILSFYEKQSRKIKSKLNQRQFYNNNNIMKSSSIHKQNTVLNEYNQQIQQQVNNKIQTENRLIQDKLQIKNRFFKHSIETKNKLIYQHQVYLWKK